MLSFFKRSKENLKKQGNDSFANPSELLAEEDISASDLDIETELSIHPDWNVSDEEMYIYKFLHNELPTLKENQISLSGIELKREHEGEVFISAFVRNSLNKPITFQKVPLMLLGPNNEHLGKKTFDLAKLGELPPRSSRPWTFIFSDKELYSSELPSSDWKLAFELKPSQQHHKLELEESWNKSLAEADKQKLAKVVEEIQPPKQGEVNFLGIQAELTEKEELQVTILIRNGSDKNLKLEKLPLYVEDASGEIIAKGGFSLNHFEVKANTSKPWTFIFPQEMISKKDADLSKWRAYPPEQKG